MAEQPVFWLGGKPGKSKGKERKPPEAERYEPALRDACAACGYEVAEYVAAQGGFGGWLAHLQRDQDRYRVFWSGKSRELRFEKSGPGGWELLRAAATEDAGVGGFVTALKAILDDEARAV